MAISTPMMIPISDTRRQEAIWTNWTRWWVMQYPAGCPYLRGIFRVLLSQYPLNFCAWYLNFVNIFTNVKLAPDSPASYSRLWGWRIWCQLHVGDIFHEVVAPMEMEHAFKAKHILWKCQLVRTTMANTSAIMHNLLHRLKFMHTNICPFLRKTDINHEQKYRFHAWGPSH